MENVAPAAAGHAYKLATSAEERQKQELHVVNALMYALLINSVYQFYHSKFSQWAVNLAGVGLAYRYEQGLGYKTIDEKIQNLILTNEALQKTKERLEENVDKLEAHTLQLQSKLEEFSGISKEQIAQRKEQLKEETELIAQHKETIKKLEATIEFLNSKIESGVDKITNHANKTNSIRLKELLLEEFITTLIEKNNAQEVVNILLERKLAVIEAR